MIENLHIILFLALASALIGFEPQLAFVHLGDEVPPSIYPAIRQARYFNPDCTIFLVTDQSPYFLFDQNFLAEEQISLINGDSLQITPQHLNFRNAAFRNHSIFYTLERFFYLFDLMEERKIENLFHLENDTLLYVELTELMPLFHAAHIQLATPFLSQVAAVPCFVFIKNLEALRPFIEYTIDWTTHAPGISDMKALAYFFQDFGQSCMTPLPTLMGDYTQPKLESFVRSDHRTPLSFLSLNSPLFPATSSMRQPLVSMRMETIGNLILKAGRAKSTSAPSSTPATSHLVGEKIQKIGRSPISLLKGPATLL